MSRHHWAARSHTDAAHRTGSLHDHVQAILNGGLHIRRVSVRAHVIHRLPSGFAACAGLVAPCTAGTCSAGVHGRWDARMAPTASTRAVARGRRARAAVRRRARPSPSARPCVRPVRARTLVPTRPSADGARDRCAGDVRGGPSASPAAATPSRRSGRGEPPCRPSPRATPATRGPRPDRGPAQRRLATSRHDPLAGHSATCLNAHNRARRPANRRSHRRCSERPRTMPDRARRVGHSNQRRIVTTPARFAVLSRDAAHRSTRRRAATESSATPERRVRSSSRAARSSSSSSARTVLAVGPARAISSMPSRPT